MADIKPLTDDELAQLRRTQRRALVAGANPSTVDRLLATRDTPKDSADARREEIERIASVLRDAMPVLSGDGDTVVIERGYSSDGIAARLYDAGLRATTGLDAVRLHGHGGIVDRCRQRTASIGADVLTLRMAEAKGDHEAHAAALARLTDHLWGIETILTEALATPQEKPAVAERTVAALRNEINNDPKRRARVDAIKGAMRCTHHPEDPCENEPSDD